MKVTFLTLAIFMGLNSFAQTHELVKHDGATQQVDFIKSKNNVIYFANPGSQEEQKISALAVASLKNMATSEQKMFSDKVTVVSKSDYDKVKVLDQNEQVAGLKKAATFTGQLNRTKGISPSSQLANTTKSIQHRAAAEGYSFVTINQKNNGTYEAIAYTY